MIIIDFSSRLKKIMNEKKLTAAELSRNTRLSEAIISKYLNGITEPRYRTLKLFAEKLNIPFAFFTGEPPFEDLEFLDDYKSVIVHALEKEGILEGFDNILISQLDNCDYWNLIDKCLTKVEKKEEGILQLTYKKTVSDNEPITIKPSLRGKGYQGTLNLEGMSKEEIIELSKNLNEIITSDDPLGLIEVLGEDIIYLDSEDKEDIKLFAKMKAQRNKEKKANKAGEANADKEDNYSSQRRRNDKTTP